MPEQVNEKLNDKKEPGIKTYETGLPGQEVKVANSMTGDQLEVSQFELDEDDLESNDKIEIADLFSENPEDIMEVSSEDLDLEGFPKQGEYFLITADSQDKIKKTLSELGYKVEEIADIGITASKEGQSFSFIFAETPEAEQKREKKENKEDLAESEVNAKVKNQAVLESRNYFQKKIEALTQTLTANKTKIEEFFSKIKSADNIKESDLDSLVDIGLDKKAIKSTLVKILPIKNQSSAANLFVKIILEENDPAKLTVESEQLFSEGNSWYHTTSEGQAALQEIESRVRSEIKDKQEEQTEIESEIDDQ
ncbi:MAG: hypothetical protein GF365_03930 [Candidatus Buchananbacteria bacterium]|nr:hypothetical protein [Candidatus Buchananbacteria bacterium]